MKNEWEIEVEFVPFELRARKVSQAKGRQPRVLNWKDIQATRAYESMLAAKLIGQVQYIFTGKYF